LNTSQQSLANLVNWPDGIQERNNSRRRPDTTGDVRKKREELTQITGLDSWVGVHRDADILPDSVRVHALSVKAQPSVTALMELHNEAIERLRVQHNADLVALNTELAAARANVMKLSKRESWLYKALFGAGLFVAYLIRS
jgi:hypothetical protein